VELQEFKDKHPEFQEALLGALVKVYGEDKTDVLIDTAGGIPNTWRVRVYADLTPENYLIWLDGLTGEPAWCKLTTG
jgi:hypothetical protein